MEIKKLSESPAGTFISDYIVYHSSWPDDEVEASFCDHMLTQAMQEITSCLCCQTMLSTVISRWLRSRKWHKVKPGNRLECRDWSLLGPCERTNTLLSLDESTWDVWPLRHQMKAYSKRFGSGLALAVGTTLPHSVKIFPILNVELIFSSSIGQHLTVDSVRDWSEVLVRLCVDCTAKPWRPGFERCNTHNKLFSNIVLDLLLRCQWIAELIQIVIGYGG